MSCLTQPLTCTRNDVLHRLLVTLVTTLLAINVSTEQATCQDRTPLFSGQVNSSHGKLRSDLGHFWQAVSEGKAKVAFMGGSITEMDGYRPMVATWLEKHFPQCEFEFIPAGISSTCSTTGAFRLHEDVLGSGPIDLLLVEFAVNDDQDAEHSPEGCRRGMEGIVRHLRLQYPHTEIVMIHFVNPNLLQTWEKKQTPLTIKIHEQVAEHYQVSSANVTAEVAEQIAQQQLTWEKYGGVHPKPYGNSIAAALVTDLLTRSQNLALSRSDECPAPLADDAFAQGTFVPWDLLKHADSWSLAVPPWDQLRGQCRDRFRKQAMLSTSTPGAELQIRFRGSAAGLYVLAGPDAGTLEYQVDDGDWEQLKLKHRHSANLHYPRTVMFATNLTPNQPHTIRCRLLEHKPTGSQQESQSAAARIVHVVVNGEPLDAN